MECNKDEGMRAKTIAEKKFADKDFAGAKKLALKARTLYPGLDGISHMLSTLDVYICYENKVNGESDWYGILNVNPSDDDETIRKQYRKLLLILHPDKNTSVGAHDAFKILLEAWTLLSDKSKRAAHNKRRNPKVSSPKERPSADRSPKDSNNTTTTPAPIPHPATTPAPAPAPAQVDQGIHMFWTSCYNCKRRLQYDRMYVNQAIQCFYCLIHFIAVEMPVPMNTIPPTQPTGLWAASILGSNNNTHAQFGGQWSNVNQGSNFYTFIPGSHSFGPRFY
nr:hypothetical protein [Tanacetum cinerariifolium]